MSIVNAVPKDLFYVELDLLSIQPDLERLNSLFDEATSRTDLIEASLKEASKEAKKYPEAFKPRKI
ncbi:MAG: hypothetical protein A2430_02810 [Candidatus Liptonbacteria bacterium RIFOXYC1_FULL_36_8]|uniref:Uncharacterized protein n=3 Tax=Candidatus Liptoniibacteriota TaxID=1817909 RepID=A0A1G2CPA1_9BACT|nr:MAG: hypothetical protein A2390_01635 [Candidatus Liptonbacteria bacterium RIFOXYB1_FULL_36_10]OGZ04152.1 MAG: hypothetical protein A2430_02810 [Candidatus Liptonbacteria bacterium RIFOXYC1_FULL_36_8]OGZ04517.1 MAG: hypothetical protein A2604_01215 [Candidatus Liptonbacteria bacterium RIFOXYD1_FULL_36_11]